MVPFRGQSAAHPPACGASRPRARTGGQRSSHNEDFAFDLAKEQCTTLDHPIGRNGGIEPCLGRGGLKLNDVFLAIVGGALHHYLRSVGELPEQSLTALVP